MTPAQKLKYLAEKQKDALLEGRVEEALSLLQEREEVVAKIREIGQKNDRKWGRGRQLTDGEGALSPEDEEAVSEALDIDREMMEVIEVHLSLIKSHLEQVSRARSLIGWARSRGKSSPSRKVNLTA